MSPLLILLETRTLPGFPPVDDPGPLPILVLTVLIPGLITLLAYGLGMGPRWLKRDAQAARGDHAAVPALPAEQSAAH